MQTTEINDVQTRKRITIRPLKARDAINLALTFTKTIGSGDELRKLLKEIDFDSFGSDKKQNEDDLAAASNRQKKLIDIGTGFVALLLNNMMEKARQPLVEFLADVSCLTVDEFEDLDLEDFFDVLQQLKESRGLQGFFGRVSLLLRQSTPELTAGGSSPNSSEITG